MHRLKTKYYVCLIIFFILGIYYPALFAPFNSIDDYKMIDRLMNSEPPDLVDLFIPHASGQYYRPLLMLTFILDGALWGFQQGGMHLENILLHLISVMLVFLIVRDLVNDEDKMSWLPFLVSLLFGVHPVLTEAVNWISGRTDLLAGMFVLLTIFLLIKGLRRSSVTSASLGAATFFAGCLSKETALFCLPILLLWCLLPPDKFPVPAGLKFRLISAGLYAAAAFGYLVLRTTALSGGDRIVSAVSRGGADSHNAAFTAVDVIRVGSKALGFYVKKLVWPFPLNFGIVSISPYYFWLGLLIMILAGWCLYRRSVPGYLFLCSLCLISPALVLPLLKITWTPLAERYIYIASAPFVIAVSLVFARFVQPGLSPNIIAVLVGFLLGGAGIATVQRNMVWQDNKALFTDTLRKSPGFAAARNELAIAYWKRGDTQKAHALLLSNEGDDFQPASLNKVRVYVNTGDLTRARTMLVTLPESVESLRLLVDIDELMRKKKSNTREQLAELDRSMLKSLQRLLQITGDPFYAYRSGLVQLRLGARPEALASFEMAGQKSPVDSHYRGAAIKLAERLKHQTQ